MQYPQIQFYKGSLVRLASGKLKRIEDLSSEDFLQQTSSSSLIDENNNSVFNSPEPTPSYDLSPPSTNLNSMKIDDNSEHFSNHDEEEDLTTYHHHHHHNHNNHYDDDEDDDDDEELVDVVSSNDDELLQNNHTNNGNNNHHLTSSTGSGPFVTTSVVKDFIEVGVSDQQQNNNNNNNNQTNGHTNGHSANQTVLIKFFIDSTRRIVFIEVPIERPFFVFHRGWSSWDPQKTYYKFGLKCRKLKIGDTCISLIRTTEQQQQHQQQQHQQHQQQQRFAL